MAAAQNRRQHPLGIGGGEHEYHPRWRFFQGFEQGVEGCRREHVALVDHIHLPAGLNRGEARALDQFADVVDTGVGGGIDLDHVEGVAGGNAGAEGAMAAGVRGGAVTADAIERARQDAGAGGLARAPGPAEQVGRGDPVLAQGVAQGGGDRLLTHQLVEGLGPVLVVQRLVGLAHGSPRPESVPANRRSLRLILMVLEQLIQPLLQLLHLAELVL